MDNIFWIVLGLVLVVEGLMPAVNPRAYRRMVQMLSERDDRSLRVIGLVMMIIGALLVYTLK